MAEVGSREIRTGVTGAIRLDWRAIRPVDSVRDVELSVLGVEHTVTGEPRRGHAVEKIDAAFDAREQVLRLADAQQVARAFGCQRQDSPVQDRVHVGLRLAERAADSEAVERQASDVFGALAPKRLERPALDDAEQ